MLFAFIQIKSQVNDISFNFSPTTNYTWWDNNLSIENGPMVGGMIGVSLGRNLELRGLYEQSLDMKNTLGKLNAPSNIVDMFDARKVDISRWGGEFKANIPTAGWFAPYLTLGTGVQKFKIDELKQERIYISGGLGTKFNIGERVALNLEAKLHSFNMDPSSILRVNENNSNDFNDWLSQNMSDDRMLNWSLNLGLQFYLGGRSSASYTALDRAYDDQFSNGLQGLRFVLEPAMAYLNFDNNTNLRDAYLLGAAAGIDFNDYMGIRGFYYRTTKDEKISTDFDDLSIYGADFIAKLNVARGIVPFMTIGGGYMNVLDSYQGRSPAFYTGSSYFAKGGLGLSIPLSKYFELFGSASLMFTTDKEELANIESTEDLRQHVMYNAGLKFNMGKAVRARRGFDTYVEQRVDDKTLMYQQRISELKGELDKAYAENDAMKASRIMAEKQRLETEMIATSDIQATTSNQPKVESSFIRLTPSELESLVDQVVNKVGAPTVRKQTPEERLDRIERILLDREGVTSSNIAPAQAAESYVPESIDKANQDLLRELQRINDRIEENSRKIDNAYRQQSPDRTVIVSPSGTQDSYRYPSLGRNNIVVSPDGTQSNMYQQNIQKGRATSWVLYQGLSPFLGIAFGDATAAVFGIKANYGFSSSNFVFAPDLYFGVGGKTAYGINANVTYPLVVRSHSTFSPYVGLGLGVNRLEKFNFGVNVIGGTYIDVGNGSLFVEYTTRRFFKNNQFIFGYRFSF